MGSDPTKIIGVPVLSCFNPRSRMGSDLGDSGVIAMAAVSIHAPAWGATQSEIANNAITTVSIHAPAWGATNDI